MNTSLSFLLRRLTLILKWQFFLKLGESLYTELGSSPPGEQVLYFPVKSLSHCTPRWGVVPLVNRCCTSRLRAIHELCQANHRPNASSFMFSSYTHFSCINSRVFEYILTTNKQGRRLRGDVSGRLGVARSTVLQMSINSQLGYWIGCDIYIHI